MKINFIILSLLGIIFMVSCNNDTPDTVEISAANKQQISLYVGENDVTALFFVNGNTGFTYDTIVNSGWSPEGRVMLTLTHGTYKCLPYYFTGQNIRVTPSSLGNSVLFEDIKFDAIPEDRAGQNEYVSPVNELWLPANVQEANQQYVIPDVTTIRKTLTRAVSQVIVHIKQRNEEGQFIPIFENPDELDGSVPGEMLLDIAGVGTSVGVNGATGYAWTYYQMSDAIINEDGSITYVGPYLFPSADAEEKVNVHIAFSPNVGIEIPQIDQNVEGFLHKNKKLEITLWMGMVNGNLDVTLGTVVEMDWDESNYAEGDLNPID